MTPSAPATPSTPPPLPVDARAERLRAALRAPRSANGSLLLLVSLAVFFLVAMRDNSVREVLVLVGVLLLHECGHLVAMRWCGFTDLRMFFLPFLGAAASGRKPGATAAEHAIVSLAGPLPSILVALPLLALVPAGWNSEAAFTASTKAPLVVELILIVAFVNAANLVPMLPFDGGRFFESVLFGRWPAVDVAFRVAAIAMLAWVAWSGLELLWVLVAVLALSLRFHARVAFASARLLRERPFPADVAALTDDDLLALHTAAQHAAGTATTRLVQQAAVSIHDRVARRPATLWQTIGLILLWALALVLAAGEVIYVMLRSA